MCCLELQAEDLLLNNSADAEWTERMTQASNHLSSSSLSLTCLYITSKLYDVQSPVATLITITSEETAGNAAKLNNKMLLDVAFIFNPPL